jgi:hypothetical protein
VNTLPCKLKLDELQQLIPQKGLVEKLRTLNKHQDYRGSIPMKYIMKEKSINGVYFEKNHKYDLIMNLHTAEIIFDIVMVAIYVYVMIKR